MIVSIKFTNGDEITDDVKLFTVNQQVRCLCLHNHNGTVDNYPLEVIKKFTLPSEAISHNVEIQ